MPHGHGRGEDRPPRVPGSVAGRGGPRLRRSQLRLRLQGALAQQHHHRRHGQARNLRAPLHPRLQQRAQANVGHTEAGRPAEAVLQGRRQCDI